MRNSKPWAMLNRIVWHFPTKSHWFMDVIIFAQLQQFIF